MTASSGPVAAQAVVLDTMLAGDLFQGKQQPRLHKYQPHLLGKGIVLSFITVAELRYGAYHANWQQKRLDALEERFRRVDAIVMPDNDLVETQARLRAQCRAAGHALFDKIHEADRWIAATAIRHGLPLVSHDGIFAGTPGLILIQEP